MHVISYRTVNGIEKIEAASSASIVHRWEQGWRKLIGKVRVLVRLAAMNPRAALPAAS